MKKPMIAALLAASVLTAPVAAQADGPAQRHALTTDDIMAMTSLRGLTCSRDGRTAA
jgi:hypothetical protein